MGSAPLHQWFEAFTSSQLECLCLTPSLGNVMPQDREQFAFTFLLVSSSVFLSLPLSQTPSPSVASPVFAGKQTIFSTDRRIKITQS